MEDNINMKSLMKEANIAQDPAIELFQRMGYKYISPEECNEQRKTRSSCLLEDILKNQLMKINCLKYDDKEHKFSEENINQAIRDLDVPIEEGLHVASEKQYNKLVYGGTYQERHEGRISSFDLQYVDWEHWENNIFHVTKEFVVKNYNGRGYKKVDIVLFVNGIPLAIFECKSAINSINEGVEQNIRNQMEGNIPHLYKFASIVIANNKNEVKYGTTNTSKEFFTTWKYDKSIQKKLDKIFEEYKLGRVPTYQDYIFLSMLNPETLLEITKYFILFEGQIKKICRYQQYYAVKQILETISKIGDKGIRKGGVIWHTQGSGKSLTMVMLANCLLNKFNLEKSKVVVVTDRKELDRQITKTFYNTKFTASQANSGRHLYEIITENKAEIITTIINKFDHVEKLQEVDNSENIFVLVDEAHRTNYGEFARKMRRVFPKACYLGFTGTPLLRKDKTARKFSGNYIHKYTIKEGVNDKVVVPLFYESRFVDQDVDKKNIDLWFEAKSKKLTELQQEDLKRKWSSITRLHSALDRVQRIALDINEHFTNNVLDAGFKAMLATNCKLDAVRYYNTFKEIGDLKVAVCISPPDDREGYESIDESDVSEVIKFWDKMMQQYDNADDYEDSIRNQFVAGEIDILIVCSKLLTGFDAPICQVIYLDKQLKEHGLIQAITRTNRVYEGKDFGLIIDYRGLIEEINVAMNMYSGIGQLNNFDGADLEGLIGNVVSAITDLKQAYLNIEDIFASIKNKRDVEEYEVLLEADDKLRQNFYEALTAFGKNLALVLSSDVAYKEITRGGSQIIENYKDKLVFYSKLRIAVKKRCAEIVDSSVYEDMMRNLLDKYMGVKDLNVITKPLNLFDEIQVKKELGTLRSDASRADAIRHNISRNISINKNKDPMFYSSLSERIANILENYKTKVFDAAQYLNEMLKVRSDLITNTKDVEYPEEIKDNINAQVYYGVIHKTVKDYGKNFTEGDMATIAKEIDDIIGYHATIDWKTSGSIIKKIEQNIDDLFYEYEKEGKFLEYKYVEFITEEVIKVEIERY